MASTNINSAHLSPLHVYFILHVYYVTLRNSPTYYLVHQSIYSWTTCFLFAVCKVCNPYNGWWIFYDTKSVEITLVEAKLTPIFIALSLVYILPSETLDFGVFIQKMTPFKTLYIIKVSNWFIDKIENFQIRAYAGCESSSSAKKFPQKDWKKKIIFCQIGVRDFQCVFLIKL